VDNEAYQRNKNDIDQSIAIFIFKQDKITIKIKYYYINLHLVTGYVAEDLVNPVIPCGRIFC
jgi:hypothetical protein